jgi:hypothetical protein
LALRLVTLEDYAHRAPAPPFIDYSRTANALAALADFSQHVQVIVLSHHRRLATPLAAFPKELSLYATSPNRRSDHEADWDGGTWSIEEPSVGRALFLVRAIEPIARGPSV